MGLDGIQILDHIDGEENLLRIEKSLRICQENQIQMKREVPWEISWKVSMSKLMREWSN